MWRIIMERIRVQRIRMAILVPRKSLNRLQIRVELSKDNVFRGFLDGSNLDC